MTLDMWSDIKQRHYPGITVYLISKGNLISATLSVHEFPHQVKSGDNIGSSLRQICEGLGIPQFWCNQLYFVTDQGRNVRAALSTFYRIPCACHKRATAVRNILPLDEQKEVSLLDNDDEPLKAAVISVITACKSLVSYMKQSGLNNKLASTLKQANDTRWNSLLVMLESITKAKKTKKFYKNLVGGTEF